MLKLSIAIIPLLIMSSAIAQNTIHLQIKSLPPYRPSGSNIYAAGSFNGWNPQDENDEFQHDNNNGNYFEYNFF